MITFPCCKINLGLKIIEKRADGYHNIETVFLPIQKNDILEIIPSKAFSFETSGLQIDTEDNSNLCIKAYNLLKSEYDLPPVKIYLYKQIPMGAGLGGGSSDCSYTLKMLNEIFSLNLNDDRLEYYASILGSDTAFFIRSTPAFATGRGNTLNRNIKITDINGHDIILICPSEHISTKEAYAEIIPSKKGLSPLEIVSQPMETWKNSLFNQFEDTIFKTHPILKEIKADLYQSGAQYSSMSGSGSAIYGIFKSGSYEIEKINNHFKSKYRLPVYNLKIKTKQKHD